MKNLAHPRCLAAVLLAWGGFVLLAAFVVICLRTGSLWPWTLVVHEDGQRTLIGTILYVEHATRELPLDILLGMAIGSCAFFAFPQCTGMGSQGSGRRRERRLATFAWAAAIVVVVILAGTAVWNGPTSVTENLLQNHTRPGAPLEWGSHWRYHLLERFSLMLISLGFAGVLRVFFASREHAVAGSRGFLVAVSSIGIYLLLTLVFAHDPEALLLAFRDPQYLGHEARELFTHALVTFPFAWGACMLTLPKDVQTPPANSISWSKAVPSTVAVAIASGVAGVLLGGYVCVAALRADSVSHGQTTDLAMLIFPHFFEHSFTYLIVPIVALLVYELLARQSSASPLAKG